MADLPLPAIVCRRVEGALELDSWNERAARAFGIPPPPLPAPGELEAFLGADIARRLRQATERAGIAGGDDSFETAHDRGGRERTYLASVASAADGRFLVAFTDISERKDAERVIRFSLAQAQASNRDLEEFAYAASHDLKEPLRAVASFVDLVARRYGSALGEQGSGWIGRAAQAAQRMGAMIDGLLALSRISANRPAFDHFPADRALDRALESLQVLLVERKAVVAREALPQLFGDEMQISRLFQNLLENAVKYARPGCAPRITVSQARSGGCASIQFRDEGIGIPAKELERIFEPFARLHPREMYPGAGLGLATCRKIAGRHCAQIRAESVEGSWSAFTLDFPLASAVGLRSPGGPDGE